MDLTYYARLLLRRGWIILLAVAITAGAAFALSKYRFRGREMVLAIIVSTLMIPTEMLVIPWYAMARSLKWVNTYWGIMFPGMISAFGVFLMRQFMQTIPDDLIDAARVDGRGEFMIFLTVVLPLVTPALATLAIFNFIGNWNAFLWPLIAASKPRMPLPAKRSRTPTTTPSPMQCASASSTTPRPASPSP